MVSQVLIAVCVVVAIASHKTSAQWWGAQSQARGRGQPSSAATGRGNLLQGDTTRYLTCIDNRGNGDDMRVTISLGRNSNGNNPWGGVWGNRFGNALSLRLSARITSGASSTLNGQFQLVVTENSRTEEGCSSQALGDILTDRSWWGQSRSPRGILGIPLVVMQGQSATSSESISNLEFEELRGRGIALCRSQQISGSTCMATIPLCCKVGLDSQPATTPFMQQGQLFPQGLQGFRTSNGMGQGLNQASLLRMNNGLGQNGFPSNNGAGSNMAGLPF